MERLKLWALKFFEIERFEEFQYLAQNKILSIFCIHFKLALSSFYNVTPCKSVRDTQQLNTFSGDSAKSGTMVLLEVQHLQMRSDKIPTKIHSPPNMTFYTLANI